MTLVTERQASEMWCPLVRRAPGGDNCDADGGRRTPRCIGPRCMAWRWTRTGMVFEVGDQGAIFRQQTVGDLAYGYCGAFGKVEP